jgi:hypothetical protein
VSADRESTGPSEDERTSAFGQIAAVNGVTLSPARLAQLRPVWVGHEANVRALARLGELLHAVEPAAALRLPTRRQDVPEASVGQEP